MKWIIAAVLASTASIAYSNNSTVSVDEIESGGYSASYFNNPSQTNPEVHVIGVYEADSSFTSGTAYVDIVGNSSVPVNLVLSAYRPTQWILQGSGVSQINSVLINGYYAGSVTGIDSARVINKTGVANWLGAYAYAWPSTSGGSNTPALIGQVESFYGAPISTFSGAYGATKFTVTLAPVPEPSSIALMVCGFAVFGAIKRQRKIS